MLKVAASCVLASRKASTCKSTPQPCAPAALLDNDFEHPGVKKAVSKGVEEYLA